jgi:hypothetical protein
MKAEEKYRCADCEDLHDSELCAQRCCPPKKVWTCSACDEVHDFKAGAEACCVICAPCGATDLTAADVHDSQLIGSLLRCRPCILAVAPEMQTADAIARAA